MKKRSPGKSRKGEFNRSMWLRDWTCKKCNYVVSDVPTKVQEQTCPKCGGQMQKIWDSPNLIFKGEGWTNRFYK